MRERALALMPSIRPIPAEKSLGLPIGVFDIDEGSKNGLMELMDAIPERLGMSKEEFSSKVRPLQGDWLTVNNMRAAQRDRAQDDFPDERYENVVTISALWHFGMNAANMIIRTHEGHDIREPASLIHQKNLLRRSWNIEKPTYAAAKALIRHSLIARIFYTVMLVKKSLSVQITRTHRFYAGYFKISRPGTS